MKTFLDLDGSERVCRILNEAWKLLRMPPANLDVLPSNVYLLPLTETRGRPSGKLGHFAPSRWGKRPDGSHEIAIHAGLFHTPKDVLIILLHEAVHGILLTDAGGCSLKKPYYHNKTYRDACEQIGLLCEFNGTQHGWNLTKWPDSGVPERYHVVLEFLRFQLGEAPKPPVIVSAPKHSGQQLPASGRVKMSCLCHHPRIIYCPKSVASVGGIRCEVCQELFMAPS